MVFDVATEQCCDNTTSHVNPILSACGICSTYPCQVDGENSFEGVCVDSEDMLDYTCYCDDFWIGKDCQIPTACQPGPCQKNNV